jgi:hypothetical protein
VNAEFNWWLLIVGLVVGAGLVWFVLLDARRREADVAAEERAREALWLSAALAEDGFDVPPDAAERALSLHQDYLAAPPPDDPGSDAETRDDWVDHDDNPADASEGAGDDRIGVEGRAADRGE